MSELKTPQLKTMLRKVGDTPIKEPELYSIIKDNDMMAIYEVPKFIIDRAGKNIDDFDSEELALLYRLAVKKITEVKNEKGEFKTTPNTENLENLSFKDRVTLFSLTEKAMKISDDKDATDKIFTEQRDLVWEYVNLDKNSLTEWEQGLVESICMAEALGVASTALDVQLGNLSGGTLTT